jgi:hypothetical protein
MTGHHISITQRPLGKTEQSDVVIFYLMMLWKKCTYQVLEVFFQQKILGENYHLLDGQMYIHKQGRRRVVWHSRAKKSVIETSASSNSYFNNHKASLVVCVIMPIWISTITNGLKLHEARETVMLVCSLHYQITWHASVCYYTVVNAKRNVAWQWKLGIFNYSKVLRADWTLMWLIFFQPEPHNIMFILWK